MKRIVIIVITVLLLCALTVGLIIKNRHDNSNDGHSGIDGCKISEPCDN